MKASQLCELLSHKIEEFGDLEVRGYGCRCATAGVVEDVYRTVLGYLLFQVSAETTCHALEAEELSRLRGICLAAYVGLVAAYDLPDEWADAFLAAGHGEPFEVDGLLPVKTPSHDGWPV